MPAHSMPETTYNKPSSATISELKNTAARLRISSIKQTTRSKSGHPTTCCSAADIVSVLFKHEMKYNVDKPLAAGNDRLILSKGHAAPLLYAAWQEVGFLKEDPIANLRLITSDLEGHPTPRLPFVDCATGSLGQGLAIAAGMAWVGKNLDKSDFQTYCILGDGECAEGAVWEACNFASHYNLSNLVGILDCNRLGQSEATNMGHDFDNWSKRFSAFGWHTIIVDGHSVEELCKAFWEARQQQDKPTMIIAKTFKGYGMGDNISDKDNWHGKPMSQEVCDQICSNLEKEISNEETVFSGPPSPSKFSADLQEYSSHKVSLKTPPAYKEGEKVATRKAYGTALAKLDSDRVVCADGDTKNSTFSIDFMKVFPERFIECFIAEQLIAGIIIGVSCRNRAITFGSTFSAFWTRAYDQIRMGAISQTNANFCGSHAGCSIGEDGPSQMALEDLGMFRSIPGSTVFYPSDAVSMENAVALAANQKGVCFLRSSRPATSMVYQNDQEFSIGQHHVVREGDFAMVIGAGITLHNALEAAKTLESEDKKIKVVDLFTIKPLNVEWLKQQAASANNRIVVVEDHYSEGGIGEAVSAALNQTDIKIHQLCVDRIPRSGPPAALMAMFKIDAAAIVEKVNSL